MRENCSNGVVLSCVAGKWKDDITDDITDLTPENLAALLEWRTFYLDHKVRPMTPCRFQGSIPDTILSCMIATVFIDVDDGSLRECTTSVALLSILLKCDGVQHLLGQISPAVLIHRSISISTVQ